MAMYYCHDCDKYIDDDYLPMAPDERCPDCHIEAVERRREIAKEMQQEALQEGITQRRPGA
jgi:rRNA maturation endonuclease Nob1